MAGARRSPPADDPAASSPSTHPSGHSSACGPDGDAKIKDKTDPDASLWSAHPSGQSSACGPDGDAKIKGKTDPDASLWSAHPSGQSSASGPDGDAKIEDKTDPDASPWSEHTSGQSSSSGPDGDAKIEDKTDPDASPWSAHPSGRSSAGVPDGDAKIQDKTAAAFLLGPRVLSSLVASDFDSDEDDDSWVGFSDRTGGGASTSTSSPDPYDYRTFLGDTHYTAQMHDQILDHSFWRNEDKTCEDFSMALQTSQTGSSRIFEKEPLSLLESECVYKAMKDKSNMLLANYSAYRKVDGDGSCFYRSFIYSYLEQLVKASPDEELRLLHALEPMLEKFQRLHWPDSYSDAYNAFVGLILECMQQRQTLSVSDYEDWLFQEIQNEEKFTGILSYLRLLTAIEICTEPEKYRDYIAERDRGNPDLVGYCRKTVIPIDAEVEQEVLVALTGVLRVPLQIVNIDISGIPEPNTHIIYESPTLPLVPCVTLLYRPGHYDILYQ